MVFYQVGKFINKQSLAYHYLVALIILGCIPFLPKIMDPFKTTGFVDENSSSAKATQYLNKQFGYDNNNKFMIMYHSSKLKMTDPEFLAKIKKSLADLDDFPMKHEILLPYKKQQVSKDKHTAYAVVIVKTLKPLTDEQLAHFKSLIKETHQYADANWW